MEFSIITRLKIIWTGIMTWRCEELKVLHPSAQEMKIGRA